MEILTWFKTDINFYSNKKIKAILSMPEGYTIEHIWFGLISLAVKSNSEGGIYFTEDVPFNDELLSIEFNVNLNIVRLALKTFERFSMIFIENINNCDVICIKNFENYQNVKAITEMKENRKNRNTRYYLNKKNKQAQIGDNKEYDDDNDEFKTSNKTPLRQSLDNDKTGQIRIEKEKRIEKEEEKKEIKENTKDNTKDNTNILSGKPDEVSEIINYLNQVLKTKYRNIKQTTILIKARLKEGFTVDDFKTVIDKKNNEWGLNDKMAQYLRPETLFSNKFESYLNQKIISAGVNNQPKFINQQDKKREEEEKKQDKALDEWKKFVENDKSDIFERKLKIQEVSTS
ncbi:MAG: phage replisome organizer N-terminal domain-containing protein [Metallibacterium sp.]